MSVMTPNEAISYIENYGWSTTRLGLDRTKELLSKLGNPQKKLKFIHIAGSNGKGSTSAMLSAILMEAGYKTGLYISPYIEVFNERIQINGEHIPGERLAEITARVKGIADEMDDHPSQFELVTAIGILYFLEENCDIVVLEVGMGGSLDSTNAIDSPEVAVITNIGLEHTEYLGDTLEEIAKTKGGIIKEGCSCVCYDGAPEVTAVIKGICEEKNVPLIVADFDRIHKIDSSLEGQRFQYGNEYTLSLLGPHQLYNASVVLETIKTLRNKGWEISDEHIKQGLKKVSWPARFEVLSKEPTFILDGGHNPQCAEALVESIKEYLPNEKILFLLGVLADKDYESIIRMMLPYAYQFICVTPISERALPGNDLADYIVKTGGKAIASDTIDEGVMLAEEIAEKEKLSIIAFGSLYLAGSVRSIFKESRKKSVRFNGVKNRNNLTEKEREDKSGIIVDRIVGLPEFKNAKNILIYKWTKGEVRLDALEEKTESELYYPVCKVDRTMLAVKPNDEDDWRKGLFGILEPMVEEDNIISPDDIDIVICPLTAFDDKLNRLGAGSGYYDRFLPKCTKAVRIGVAYDNQWAEEVPMEAHDIGMDIIITEERTLRWTD